MNLVGVPAYGVQLAEVLADVLKLGGHLPSPPKDLHELLAAAKAVVSAGPAGKNHVGLPAAPQPGAPDEAVASYVHTVPDHCDRIVWRGDYVTLRNERHDHKPPPVFVVEMNGGTIVKTHGTVNAEVIFIDEDTEGGDRDQVMNVLGQDHYVIEHMVTAGMDSAALIERVQGDIFDAEQAAEAALPLPRYVTCPDWKLFLDGMEDEQTMRLVYDTETKALIALELETEQGYALTSAAVRAQVLDSLISEPEPLAEADFYGLEYVDQLPEWALPGLLPLPDPVVFSGLVQHDGPPNYSLRSLQDHAIAYVSADRVAAGRVAAFFAPPIELPPPPAPAYPGIPSRGVEGNFSTEQMFEYRKLAAEMDRQAYAQTQDDTGDDDAEAPRM
jgi:hypothetical protein